MKKYLLLLLTFTLFSFSVERWYKQVIVQNINVLFPDVPVKLDTIRQITYSYHDEKGIYITSVTDLNNFVEGGFSTKDEVNGFYEGAIKGILKRYHGKLIQSKDFYFKGLKGIDLEFAFFHPSGFEELRFVRFLVVNESSIILQFGTKYTNSESSIPDKDKFFNSLTLEGNENNWWQYNDNVGNRIAAKAGRITGYCLPIILIIIGLYYFIAFVRRQAPD